jgi:hypothetical protein
MTTKTTEANLLGFKILIDRKGRLFTEISGVPEKDLPQAFSGDDLRLMRQIQRLLRPKIQEIHKFLENEISALNHPA